MKRLLLMLSLLWATIGISYANGVIPEGLVTADTFAREMRIVIDRDTDTVTMNLNLAFDFFDSQEQDYLWLVAVDGDDITVLENDEAYVPVTYAEIETPEGHTCGRLREHRFGHGDGSSNFAGIDHTMLASDEIRAWLEENNHDTSTIDTVLDEYIADGLNFLAFPVSMTDHIKEFLRTTIRYSTDTDQVRVPMLLSSATNTQAEQVVFRIFSDAPYAPQDAISLPELPLDDLTRYSTNPLAFTGLGRPEPNTFALYSYTALANPDVIFPQLIDELSAEEVRERTARENATEPMYISEYRVLLTQDATTDPIFSPTEPQERYMTITPPEFNPLKLYNCITETIGREPDIRSMEDLAPHLPSANMHLGDITTNAYYPEDWVANIYRATNYWGEEITALAVFSPEELSLDDLNAISLGEREAPPMFVVHMIEATLQLDPPIQETLSNFYEQRQYSRELLLPMIGEGIFPRLFSWWIIDEDEYAANEAQFVAMQDYFELQQYTLHPDLMHTLYIQPNPNNSLEPYFQAVRIGYPETWDFTMPSADTIRFEMESGDVDAYVQVRGEKPEVVGNHHDDYTLPDLIAAYPDMHLTTDAIAMIDDSMMEETLSICDLTDLPPLPYEDGDESGYLVFRYEWLFVSGDAPDELIRAMADSAATNVSYYCP